MPADKLSDATLRNAKPAQKPLKLWDGGGLFMLVTPGGGKWWRLKYRVNGREKLLSLGTYPAVGLKEARKRRDAARQQLAHGIDPGSVRRAEKAAQSDTFEAVAREWHAKHRPNWAVVHAERILRRLEADVFPRIGNRPINEVEAPELLAALRLIEERGALEMAHRALANCSQIFRYAVATGRASRDPAADLRGALPARRKIHFPAITEPKPFGELLRAIDGYSGSLVVRCALRVAPLLFVRPGELRGMEWAEITLDGDTPTWSLPAARMKMREPHLVPLAPQAVALLREVQPLTGNGRYVFPSERSVERPISENTLNGALRRLGYPKEVMTAHGFRAAARTILHEVLGVDPDVIEAQLAHRPPGPLGAAYNRTKHLEARRDMMRRWANYCDSLKEDSS